MAVAAFARKIFLLALVGYAAANIPYTNDGLTCLPDASLSYLNSEQLKSCRDACKRVEDTANAQKIKNCAKTVKDVHRLMLAVDGTEPLTTDEQNDLLKSVLEKGNCLHDIELHYKNREKFCTLPGSVLGTTEDPVQVAMTRASAMRRFAEEYLHYYLVAEKEKNGKHEYCFPAMLQILNNPAATAFTNGACKSIFTEHWKTGDCSSACWQSIKDAAAAAGSAKCCLAKYYEEMLRYTYGSSVPLTGTQWVSTTGAECDISSLPCTPVHDVLEICIAQHGAGDPTADDYMPHWCASASTLSKSFLMVAASVLVVFSSIYSRN